MSEKKLNAIKEVEFRIKEAHEASLFHPLSSLDELQDKLTYIDFILFDINDFINDLKDTDETN